MPLPCSRDLWAISGRSLGDLWAISGRSLGDLWAISGRPLGDLWAISGRPEPNQNGAEHPAISLGAACFSGAAPALLDATGSIDPLPRGPRLFLLCWCRAGWAAPTLCQFC